MLSALMITRLSLRLGTLVLLGAVWSAACQKVPLLAPSGSTIVLTASNNAIAANGTVALIAQVLEPSGTPPHPGTHVTFTTTLGVIEPADATTDINGQARVTFKANGANGTATITASSGGATTGTNGSVKIAVGSAAVGRITLTANPSIIPATGGSSAITASVVDVNGNALPGVPVTFATSAGVLSNGLVNTDATGTAQATLTTSVEATVTATAGVTGSSGTGTGTGTGTGNGTGTGTNTGSTSSQSTATVTVRVNPLPTVSITATGTSFTAGSPIAFTISAQPATNSTAQIREVVVSFGDGTVRNLGAVSGTTLVVQHRYDDEGIYTVSVRVTDTLGSVVTAATVIVVEAQAPLAVAISHTQTTNVALDITTVNFTATVTPSSAVVSRYVWNFGDGTPPVTTTSNQTVHQYNDDDVTKIVTVTVTTTTGQTATGTTSIAP